MPLRIPMNAINHSDDVINLAQFEELQALLEEDFIDLIKNYIIDSKIRLQELQMALDNYDNRAGFEAAHSLKGASANFGATNLTELCYQIQEICRENTLQDHQLLVNDIAGQSNLVNAKILALIGE